MSMFLVVSATLSQLSMNIEMQTPNCSSQHVAHLSPRVPHDYYSLKGGSKDTRRCGDKLEWHGSLLRSSGVKLCNLFGNIFNAHFTIPTPPPNYLSTTCSLQLSQMSSLILRTFWLSRSLLPQWPSSMGKKYGVILSTQKWFTWLLNAWPFPDTSCIQLYPYSDNSGWLCMRGHIDDVLGISWSLGRDQIPTDHNFQGKSGIPRTEPTSHEDDCCLCSVHVVIAGQVLFPFVLMAPRAEHILYQWYDPLHSLWNS